jgi:hypothetical protein
VLGSPTESSPSTDTRRLARWRSLRAGREALTPSLLSSLEWLVISLHGGHCPDALTHLGAVLDRPVSQWHRITKPTSSKSRSTRCGATFSCSLASSASCRSLLPRMILFEPLLTSCPLRRTYVFLWLRPPRSILPSMPPTEALASFFLACQYDVSPCVGCSEPKYLLFRRRRRLHSLKRAGRLRRDAERLG